MSHKFLYKVNSFSTTGFYISHFRDEVEVGHLLRMQKSKVLPEETSAYQGIVVHQKHLWVSLDGLFFFFYLLFYSSILESLTYYSFHCTNYSH